MMQSKRREIFFFVIEIFSLIGVFCYIILINSNYWIPGNAARKNIFLSVAEIFPAILSHGFIMLTIVLISLVCAIRIIYYFLSHIIKKQIICSKVFYSIFLVAALINSFAYGMMVIAVFTL